MSLYWKEHKLTIITILVLGLVVWMFLNFLAPLTFIGLIPLLVFALAVVFDIVMMRRRGTGDKLDRFWRLHRRKAIAGWCLCIPAMFLIAAI